MRYLSLFSGIEAATVAWAPLGWQASAFAEVEASACAVLKHQYPTVPNLGDVTKITEEKIMHLGHIDIVVFGFPCQDLSVAGKRAGLKGERSGLFFTAMRIVRWSRARFALFENVPGLFSSEQGRDFAAVVGEMVGVEFDVPESGWRNTGVAVGPNGLLEWSVLDAQWFGVPQRRRRIFAIADFGDWASRPPLLLESESMLGNPPTRQETGQRLAPTISARTKGGGGLGTDFDLDRGLIASTGDVSHCLNAGGQVAIAFNLRGREDGAQAEVSDVASLRSASGGSSRSFVASSAVRRLTPEECESLQGFPRRYTKVPYRGKIAADGPRYKSLGNSMAVPVMRWIGQRIQQVIKSQR